MGAKKREKPKRRVVIVQVRAAANAPLWWPKRDDEAAWVSIDPYDPPSWSTVADESHAFDSIQLWRELQVSVAEWVEHLESEWREEYDPEDHLEEGPKWEFRVQDLPTS